MKELREKCKTTTHLRKRLVEAAANPIVWNCGAKEGITYGRVRDLTKWGEMEETHTSWKSEDDLAITLN